jgi:membrane protease YdiL (CAAX protease family)
LRERRFDWPLLGGLAVAFIAFGLTFRGPPARFWQRMTFTGLTLGTLAIMQEPGLRRTRIGPRDLLLGAASAGGLYGIFRVGDRLARRMLASGGREIEDIYALRGLRSPLDIGARLAAVIGPAEELFWRGFVQRRLARRYGTVAAGLAASSAYGGAHVVTGNTTLIGAATTAGLYWSALAACGMPMGALIVSHVVWDVWIFLVAPTVEAGPSAASGPLRRLTGASPSAAPGARAST